MRTRVPAPEGARVTTRTVYLDNLKIALIASIIALHAVLGYASVVEVWTYTELREVSLQPVPEVVLFVLVAPFGFFLIGLLFLVAGLLTAPSLERKGPARYARDRLVRLGVPFVVYVFAIQPTATYLLEHPLGDATGSYAQEYLGAERRLDTGPLWFVGVLLVFSLAYAGLVAAGARVPRSLRPVSGPSRLLALAAVVAVLSFAVRLVYPYGGEAGFTDLNLWEWPGCAAMFGLGVAASRWGWVDAVPTRLWRGCRTATLVAGAGMAGVLTVAGLRDSVAHAMGGGHWLAVGFAVTEAVLVVTGSVWMLSAAQRHLTRRHRLGPVLARSAYLAFMLQTPVLLALAGALRPLPWAAEPKALVVAAAGVAASFGSAALALRWVPGLRRVV